MLKWTGDPEVLRRIAEDDEFSVLESSPMTFDQIPAAAAVFLDANTLVYHFTNHPIFGPACTQLVKRIEHQHLSGFISTHVLARSPIA